MLFGQRDHVVLGSVAKAVNRLNGKRFFLTQTLNRVFAVLGEFCGGGRALKQGKKALARRSCLKQRRSIEQARGDDPEP